jgi:proteasome lid subunit RPN8/RPN11
MRNLIFIGLCVWGISKSLSAPCQQADSAQPMRVAAGQPETAEPRGKARVYQVHFLSGQGIWPASVDTARYHNSLDMRWQRGLVRFAWAKSRPDSVYEIFVYDQAEHRILFRSDAGDSLALTLARPPFEVRASVEKGSLRLRLANGSPPFFLALSQSSQRHFWRLETYESTLSLDGLGAVGGPYHLSVKDRFSQMAIGPDIQASSRSSLHLWHLLLIPFALTSIFLILRHLPARSRRLQGSAILLLLIHAPADARAQSLEPFSYGGISYRPSLTLTQGEASLSGNRITLTGNQEQIRIQINLDNPAANLRIRTSSGKVSPPKRGFPAVFTLQTSEISSPTELYFEIVAADSITVSRNRITLVPSASEPTEPSPPTPTSPKPKPNNHTTDNPSNLTPGSKIDTGDKERKGTTNTETSDIATGDNRETTADDSIQGEPRQGDPSQENTSGLSDNLTPAPPQPSPAPYISYYFLAGAALCLLAIVAILFARKKRDSRASISIGHPSEPPSQAPADPGLPSGGEAPEITFTLVQPDFSDIPTLASLAASNEYVRRDLRQCWKASAVHELFLHYRSLRGIDQMVREQNYDKLADRTIEEIPEIGGFLLGYAYPKGEATYSVAVEHFVPITAESQDRYTVRFGDQAWMELSDAYTQHPGTKLVGWFHTHPGHGLFLSEADRREHRQLFQQRYQIAIELDPTTEGFEVAFFTWQPTGELNNDTDRQLSNWWTLRELLSDISPPH